MIIRKFYAPLLLLILSFGQFSSYAQTSDIPLKLTVPVINYRYNSAYGDYYLQSLTMKENRWTNFPITININGIPTRYKYIAISAINEWKPYIPIKITTSSCSNIIINWVTKMPAQYKCYVGLADHRYSYDIHKCIITILDKKHYSSLEKKEIITHELGHALGLDHSPNSKDIMYQTIKPCKKPISSKKLVSNRDLNTLAKIYSDLGIVQNYKPVNTVNAADFNSNLK